MGGKSRRRWGVWVHGSFALVLVCAALWTFLGPSPKSSYQGRLWPKAERGIGATLVYGYTEGLNGPYAITPRFEAAFDFRQGMALVCSGGLWGWINRTGDFVIPPTFPMALPFDGNLAAAQDAATGKYGLIGRGGDFVIRPKYDGIQTFGVNNLGVGANTYRARMRAKGYVKISYSSERNREPAPIILAHSNGLWGAINRKGETVLKPQFDEVLAFQDYDLAHVVFYPSSSVVTWQTGAYPLGTKYGLLASDGVLAPGRYDEPARFSNGMAAVCCDDKWGYINTRFEEIIAPKFEKVRQFDGAGDCILARLDGKWGVIDRMGAWVLEPQFDGYTMRKDGYVQAEWFADGQGAGPFSKGEISLSERLDRQVESALITPDGKLLPGRYGFIGGFSDGLARVSHVSIKRVNSGEAAEPVVGVSEVKWGYIDEEGNVVIEPRYESASFFANGRARVVLDGKKLVIDKTGAVIEDSGPNEKAE